MSGQAALAQLPPDFPPWISYGGLKVTPPDPTTEDAIAITVRFTLPTPCYTTTSTHTVVGQSIRILVTAVSSLPPGSACVQIVKVFSVTEQIGKLAQGTYSVSVSINGQTYETTTFSVSPHPAGLLRYDDFSAGQIDAAKWQNLEQVREIRAGKLVSKLGGASSPSAPHNALQFANPTTIASIQADARLTAYAAPPGGSSRILLRGSFYGSGATGAGKTGDVTAEIVISTGATTGIGYRVFRCTDDPCASATDVIPYTSLSPTVTLGRAYTLGIGWTGSMFTFTLDGTTAPPVDPKPIAPITRATPNVPERLLGTQLWVVNAGGEGSVTGDFDNVYVNGALYDDFDGAPHSGPRLDPAKWASLEFVREIQNGRLVSVIASSGAVGEESTDANYNYTRFLNSKSVTAVRADVTVNASESSGSAVTAILKGWFYNDGASTGLGDQTGDVSAWVRIASGDGSPLTLMFDIFRCSDAGCNSETTIFHDSLGTVDLGASLTLFLAWDGSVFTYGMDGVTRTYDPKPLAPPAKPVVSLGNQHLRTKVGISAPGGYGYLAATFDNVYVNAEAVSPPKLAPFLRETLTGDVASAGVGLRGTGTGTINLTTVPPGATVKKAYLYWATLGTSDTFTTPTLNGNQVSGTRIGQSDDPGWAGAQAFTYRADVTNRLGGNGAYTIAGLPAGPTPPEDLDDNDSEGASLVVLYALPGAPARTVLINEGAVTLSGSRLQYYATPFTGFAATSPPTGAKLTFVVGDGQSLTPEYAGLDTTLLSANAFSGSDGPYWDTRTYDVSSAIAAGATNATAVLSTANDSLVWVAAILSVPVVLPTVTVTAPDATATENPLTAGTFRLTRTGPTTDALTVTFTRSGSATAGSDYLSFPMSLSIPAEQGSADITLTPINDTLAEGPETVILTLSANAAYTIGTPSSASVTITSEDRPTVTVTACDPTATESPLATGAFCLTCTGATAGPLAVSYTMSGTASVGADYQPLGTNVTFPACPGTRVIPVTPVDDCAIEAPEPVLLTLSPNVAYTVGTPASATVTIVSDDCVTVTASDPTATENPLSPGTFTFTRRGCTATPLTVPFTVSGTATPGADYAALPSSVTFPMGMSSVTLTLTPINDSVAESSETVTIILPPSLACAPVSATVTISSEDLPVLTVTAPDNTATENPLSTGTFRVARTGPTTSALTVAYAVGGTATPGSDYSALTGGVTIPAGQSSATITVSPLNDTLAEAPETVILTLNANPAYVVGTPRSATVTITSEDKPTITLTAPDPLATESPLTSGTFRVSRTGPTTNPLLVTFTRSGTATAGSDYLNFPLSLSIPAGRSSAEITVAPIADTLAEPVETVTLALSASSVYGIGTPSSATVSLVSAEDNAVTLTVPDPLATESPLTSGTFRVSRTGPTTNPLLVTFTRSGTAAAGLDYVDFPLTLTIPAGANSKDLLLTPKVDALAEPVETVTLTLSANPAYGIGSPRSATVSIVSAEDNVVTLTAPDNLATESPLSTGTFRVTRTGPTTSPVTVFYTRSGTATPGSDYLNTFSATSVTIPTGQSGVTLTITPINDSLIEAPETVILTLTPSITYGIGSPSTATVTISSDEKPVVTLTAPDSSVGESPLNPGTFRITRTGLTNAPLPVTFTRGGTAVAGSDYVIFALAVTIPIGASAADLPVTPLNDAYMEFSETVVLTLTPNPSSYTVGSPGTATVTIVSEELISQTVTVTASDPTATEVGLTTGRFTFTRTGTAAALASALTLYYTVSGTATAGSDYASLGSSVAFSAGVSTVTKIVTPRHDNLQEPDETVIVTLTQSANYAVGNPSSATVTLSSLQYKVHGLNFSPYVDGQDPNTGSVVPEEQLRARMEIIAPYTRWIRTFGVTNGLERAGAIAHSLGLKAALGAWLSKDLQANEFQLANLIAAGKAGQADLLIVGSETLLRGDLTEAALIAYMTRVKTAVPGIPVTTGEVYSELLAHRAVIRAVDVLFVNYYPYWEGVHIDHAIAALHGWHKQIVAAAGGKQVLVSETGWPSCGNPVGEAVPSPENAAGYFLGFQSWAQATGVDSFYFEAFDESWKAKYEGPQGPCWGIFDKDGRLKPGMEDVFNGKTVPDTWSGTGLIGGPGQPGIRFTSVPAYGSFENLKGDVLHIRPVDSAVAVYIKVRGGWWTKPYFATPITSIFPDGTWSCDISAPQQAASEMRVDPSQSACRSRLQTTASGSGQKPRS